MEITAALGADLTELTGPFDTSDPNLGLESSLRQLAADTKLAVRSYLGLSVTITIGDQQITLTGLEAFTQPGDIVTSLLVPLPAAESDGTGPPPQIGVVLYAGKPGAYVDLAADLAWLTGRPLGAFVLDRHLTPPGTTATTGLRALSVINRAIGVLIDRGHTPGQARRELDARATRGGTDRRTAADLLLAGPGRRTGG